VRCDIQDVLINCRSEASKMCPQCSGVLRSVQPFS
jgi:hypothetical protein